MEAEINTVACPACGCWLKKNWPCFCGERHPDVCGNCCRRTTLAPTRSIELSVFYDSCDKGPVFHTHQRLSNEERNRRQAIQDAEIRERRLREAGDTKEKQSG